MAPAAGHGAAALQLQEKHRPPEGVASEPEAVAPHPLVMRMVFRALRGAGSLVVGAEPEPAAPARAPVAPATAPVAPATAAPRLDRLLLPRSSRLDSATATTEAAAAATAAGLGGLLLRLLLLPPPRCASGWARAGLSATLLSLLGPLQPLQPGGWGAAGRLNGGGGMAGHRPLLLGCWVLQLVLLPGSRGGAGAGEGGWR